VFKSTGCAGCHQPEQQVVMVQPDGQPLEATIAPFTDLGIHDLGPGLADHEVSGALHPTRFRTAPLFHQLQVMALGRIIRGIHAFNSQFLRGDRLGGSDRGDQ
jgi:CxxC motif-containing protein (DUF1111 family)